MVDSNRTLGDIVSYQQLITSQKFTHFANIKRDSGYDYDQMIFIDDEYHNIEDACFVKFLLLLDKHVGCYVFLRTGGNFEEGI